MGAIGVKIYCVETGSRETRSFTMIILLHRLPLTSIDSRSTERHFEWRVEDKEKRVELSPLRKIFPVN